MDIISRLERIKVNRFHYKLLIVMGVAWLFDAMNTGIIAFVLPTLTKDWGLSSNHIGLIGSMGLIGMAIGAVISGMAADRWGRKTIIVGTLIIFSVGTALCGLAVNMSMLLIFRFIAGLGLGGQLPVAATLISEFSPTASRGRMLVLLESFWAFGWLAAALLSYLIIPMYGWPMVFYIGGLPLLYVFYLAKTIPESVRYLVSKGRIEEAHEIVCFIEKTAGITPCAKAVAPDSLNINENKFSDLFSGMFLRRTIMLWLLWFGLVYSYYGIFTWLPSLMVKSGHTVVKTFEYVLVMTIAQIPGYYSAAYLVDRIGRKITMFAYLALSAVAAYLFGQGGNSTWIMVWGSLMSFFNLGAWGILYTYTPELYPTRIRALGSGWAGAIGRLGGIVAPVAVGLMLTAKMNLNMVFNMFTAVMLFIALTVWVLGEETKGRTLDQINQEK